MFVTVPCGTKGEIMFLAQDLDKVLNDFLLDRFLNCFRGCGKTASIWELARKNEADGRSTAIVTTNMFCFRKWETDLIKLVHPSKVFKELKNFPILDEKPDNAFVYRKELNCLKDFDYVLIDPAVYEEVIRCLRDKLESVKIKADKIKDEWRSHE